MARRRIPSFLADLLSTTDRRLVAGWYRAVSVSPERVRGQLRRARKPFADPRMDAQPTLIEIDQTARWMIEQSRSGAATLAGIAGLGGLASVPPEVVARMVAILRLAQRIAVIYGLEPDSDRGRMVLWRALAAGMEVELDDQGPVGFRSSEILLPATVEGSLARRMLRVNARKVGGRILRYVPVLSAALAVRDTRRDLLAVGERIATVMRSAAELEGGPAGVVEDAQEVV